MILKWKFYGERYFLNALFCHSLAYVLKYCTLVFSV